ncbi:Carnitine O-palmitoyltransferase 1, liver isoform [Toxocara canis]|uniref:Carnitine O-palmitoyltransferase 1, liver isoform n=1 Tax=Toxocara canis TaxID=6265 RepID=A0A0B2V879_TOXCA|nr:Carnitine O-palmitoyltransferase 1, liver isoform [Toxocara canis]
MPSALAGAATVKLPTKAIPKHEIPHGTTVRIKSPENDSTRMSFTKGHETSSRAHALAHLPFQPVWHYPSTLERIAYKVHIAAVNRLWPIRPLYFCTAVAAAAAYHVVSPANVFLSLVPYVDSSLLHILRVGLISFATVYIPVVVLRYALKHVFFGYHGYLFENPLKPSLKTKIWRTTHKILSYAPRRLQSCDALLPNLPLPKLRDTIERYLDATEPILTEAEHEELKEKAKEFAKRDGMILQSMAWIYACFVDNYATPFWEKYAYLACRNGLLAGTSFGHCDVFQQKEISQAERVARFMYTECLTMIAVDREQIIPPGKGLMCAEHFKKYYTTVRIPGERVDTLRSRFLSRHFVLYHKGCYYKVDAFDENNQLYSIEHLTDVINELLARKDEPIDGEEYVAALTTDSREKWCENRKRFFLENAINKRTLEAIESSITFGSLEDFDVLSSIKGDPELLDQFDKFMLLGNGKNIWADKSVCFSISRNARWGGTNEHSIGDAIDCDMFLENYVFMDYCLSHDPTNAAKLGRPSATSANLYKQDTKKIERLKFEINEEMKSEIMRCYSDYKPRAEDVDVALMCFTEFGKGLIKKGNVSPDGFIQMAIQLAQYKDQRKFVHTYESASTRLFANSRTETLRSVTKESCAFVRAMFDPSFTKEERLRLLRLAVECHVQHNRECMVGKGFDRHLFVLYIFSRMIGISSPFLNYFISQSWPLSTSQAPKVTSIPNEDKHPDLSWFGGAFAAVAKDGYGICYRFAGNHSICVHITSYRSAPDTDSHRFRNHLADSFRQMAALFSTHTHVSPPNFERRE